MEADRQLLEERHLAKDAVTKAALMEQLGQPATEKAKEEREREREREAKRVRMEEEKKEREREREAICLHGRRKRQCKARWLKTHGISGSLFFSLKNWPRRSAALRPCAKTAGSPPAPALPPRPPLARSPLRRAASPHAHPGGEARGAAGAVSCPGGSALVSADLPTRYCAVVCMWLWSG
jgi:hypothetical protein